MKAVVVEVLLALAVAAAWLGALGFARLKTALDRLHCATFVNVVTGLLVAVAAWIQEGPTSRTFKIAAVLVFALLIGAAASHAIGRALHLRGDDRE